MWNEHIEAYWEEYYSIYPEARQEHINTLETIVEGKFRSYLESWLSVAIHNNHIKAISKILDVLTVPDDNMTLKERLCYYQLTQE